MNLAFRTFGAAMLLLFSLIVMTPVAAADPLLDAAKRSGQVGERADGYLGFAGVSSQSSAASEAELKRRVAEINARRREVYTRLSKRTGESLQDIAKLTGERQIQRAKPGEFIMDASGRWVRK